MWKASCVLYLFVCLFVYQCSYFWKTARVFKDLPRQSWSLFAFLVAGLCLSELKGSPSHRGIRRNWSGSVPAAFSVYYGMGTDLASYWCGGRNSTGMLPWRLVIQTASLSKLKEHTLWWVPSGGSTEYPHKFACMFISDMVFVSLTECSVFFLEGCLALGKHLLYQYIMKPIISIDTKWFKFLSTKTTQALSGPYPKKEAKTIPVITADCTGWVKWEVQHKCHHGNSHSQMAPKWPSLGQANMQFNSNLNEQINNC